MDNTRIKINSIVEDQLPSFVRENFPLVQEFLKEYYKSLDLQGGAYDVLTNIDKQTKVDSISNLVGFTVLKSDVDLFSNTINVESTEGFPDTYGLIKIDSEIILYKSKTNTSFEECVRGFSGISSYGENENFIFEDTLTQTHLQGTEESPKNVFNLSILFLKEYYNKVKKQFLPGFEGRKLFSSLNSGTFLKNSKDFYSSKGTDESFKILFRVLFGASVEVIKPRDYLIQPSDAQYRITKDLIVEEINGSAEELKNRTIFQDQQQGNISKAFGTVTDVQRIIRNGKPYHVLKLDNDFNKDINVIGTVFGDFSIHPKTKIKEKVLTGSDYINVDSTVGFPESGTLVYKGLNGYFVITYEEKSLTQFNKCSNIIEDLSSGEDILLDVFAFGYSSSGSIISFRIGGVVSNTNIIENGKGYTKDDPIKLVGYGYDDPKDFKSNDWIFNVSVNCEVESITKEKDTGSSFSYTIKTYDNTNIYNKDSVEVDYFSLTNNQRQTEIFDGVLVSETSVPTKEFKINNSQKSIDKIFSVRKVTSLYDEKYSSDVINVYKNKTEKSLYVASNSLPNYGNSFNTVKDFKFEISKVSFDGITITQPNHGFLTGDAVLYTFTGENEDEKLLIETGVYYVKRESSSEFKLSRSKENIEKSLGLRFDNAFVNLLSPGTSKTLKNNFISLLRFSDIKRVPDVVGPQKLIRRLTKPKTSDRKDATEFGCTGIFLNGVELLNYKSSDKIFYGPLESIEVIDGGINYSVTEPPKLEISSSIGSSATGHCGVEGSLTRIDVIDPGYDYIENPLVTITGGSGSGAKAEVKLIPLDNSVVFDSSVNNTRINPTDPFNQIGFSTFHKLFTGEKVNYNSNGQTEIGGLKSGSDYYVNVVDDFTIRLFDRKEDSINNTNEVDITSFGEGNHTIKSEKKKFSIGSISVLNTGFGYKNKKIIVNPTGVNTAFDEIRVYEHPYQSGEIITYSYEGTPISGLSTGSYYVTRLDEKRFKLSNIGIGTTAKSFFYDTKQYINFNDGGQGRHIFNYEPIKVTISGSVGVSTVNQKEFNAEVLPYFRGEVKSIFLDNNGVGYGSSDIINYNRQPEFNLNSGSGAKVVPVISNGSIVEVLISDSGSGYITPPDILIFGTGSGASLVSIIEDGKLKEVKVVYGGKSYNSDTTRIEILTPGVGCKLRGNIKTWTINNFTRLLESDKISFDDSVAYRGLNPKYGLQYTHLYTPRELRKKLLSEYTQDDKIQYRSDYLNDSREDKYHSPIVGWAYDGNPIYGPYGYESLNSTTIKKINSGYSDPKDEYPGRPDRKIYPAGFFVEDYNFTGEGDLDENNGRFCITPEYPNGTYAYFTTIEDETLNTTTNIGVGIFNGDKVPRFPYVVGKNFYSNPIKENFEIGTNQERFNFLNPNILRNTNPYNLTSSRSEYKFLENNNKTYDLKNSKIKSTFSSSLDDIKIISGGDNYSIGDSVIFDNSGTGGSRASFEVGKIYGKDVISLEPLLTTFEDVEFTSYRGNNRIIGFCTETHNLKNNDLLVVKSIINDQLRGQFKPTIPKNTLSLSLDVNDDPTKTVTYFSVDGSLTYPNIKENDVYTLESEKVKILNVDEATSRIRVLRGYNSTAISSHSVSTVLVEESNKIVLEYPNSDFKYDVNREYYFDPVESIGFGTEKSLKVFGSPGSGVTSITINPRYIYLKDHNLKSGTIVEYTSNGSPIAVSTDGTSISSVNDGDRFYITNLGKDFVGISTVKVGLSTFGEYKSPDLSSGLLFINSAGIGTYHSFKTEKTNTLLCNINKNEALVSTASTTLLKATDKVDIEIYSGISTTYSVKYNDFYRRIVVNQKEFISSDIDLTYSTIRIPSHNFISGDKVIYNSTSPSSGLTDNQIYYISVYDENRIRLCNSQYDATKKNPFFVTISSISFGTLSPINPKLNIIRNSKIILDLSDSSLSVESTLLGKRIPSFSLEFFTDESLSNRLFLVDSDKISKIRQTGIIGVDSNAKVEILIDNTFPDNFYYNLVPDQNPENSRIKKECKVDEEVIFNNLISLRTSVFYGTKTLSGVGTDTFTFSIGDTNESSTYNTSNSSISYTTNSSTAKGKISSFNRISGGFEYETLPSIIEIDSQEGTGAIVLPVSSSVGSIKNTEIVDIGYEYSVDNTIVPRVKSPLSIRVEPLSKLASVGISSVGRFYKKSPTLIVKDGFTGELIDDLVLDYDIEKYKVTIIKNTKGFYNTTPDIIPIRNTNGIKISLASYNPSTKEVTLTLNKVFTLEEFPFEVGDKIIVEGTSTTSGITYNSKEYDYSLFEINEVDLSGPLPTIKYSIEKYLSSSLTPGTFDVENSSGIVTPEKYFPKFNVQLVKNDFSVREVVKFGNKTGKVVSWDSKNEILKVETAFEIEDEEIIRGLSSNTSAFIKENSGLEFYYDISSSSRVIGGWNKDTGFLNNSTQKIADNDYYQYFSYSLKSEIPLDKWFFTVSNLNHTVGFKKFGDLQVVSTPDSFSGITTVQRSEATDIVIDLNSQVNVNCLFDYDLVTENYFYIDKILSSDQIYFESRILQDYSESIGNRVLLIDDISNEFNTNLPATFVTSF